MINFEVTKTKFDKHFIPDQFSRLTTNLINLSKDLENRETNISQFFTLINNKINKYLESDLPTNRYKIHLSILRTSAWFKNKSNQFPVSEILAVDVEDTLEKKIIQGPIGLNFSSYLRDFDFHIKLPKILNEKRTNNDIDKFGQLHGLLYKLQFKKYNPNGIFDVPAIIAISVSENKEYLKTKESHPCLGELYSEHGAPSFTSNYFQKMGLKPSFFMPKYAVAPLAIYHEEKDLLNRNEFELFSLIAVMETLQQIYRPEIYSSNVKAGHHFKPSLQNVNYTQPSIHYDRNERNNRLIASQSAFVETTFIEPNKNDLEYLNNNYKNIYPMLSLS